jgi:hypothetical protein
MHFLGTYLGFPSTENEEGPMSVWEAIQQLRTEVKLTHAIGQGHHFLYLTDLRKHLLNWGTLLNNLAKTYQENLPKIGTNLSSLDAKVCLLETNAPASNVNPFMSLGNPLGVLEAVRDLSFRNTTSTRHVGQSRWL